MKPKNFPGRKQIRREAALARLPKQQEQLHVQMKAHKGNVKQAKQFANKIVMLLAAEANTTNNLVENARMIRTKVSREVKKYG